MRARPSLAAGFWRPRSLGADLQGLDSDDSSGLELPDLDLAVAKLPEDLAVVLAEKRRGHPNPRRRRGQLEWQADLADRTEHGVLDVYCHGPSDRLRHGECFNDVVDSARRDVRRHQP